MKKVDTKGVVMTAKKRTSKKAPTTEDVLQDIDERSQELDSDSDSEDGETTIRESGMVSPTAPTRPKGQKKQTPEVLTGRVKGEEIDPDAARALKDPEVAAKYRGIKDLIREYLEIEGRRTEVMKSIASQLVDLRGQFKQPGSRGRRKDWNGESDAYRSLAHLVYLDAGAVGPDGESLKRAIRYHVEQRKREIVPKKDWDHYGIHALSQSERQQLAKKFASEHEALTSGTEEVGTEVKIGSVTGSQLVSLAKTIEKGVSVYEPSALRRLTPKQRNAFRERMQHVREQADSLLGELDSMD